MIILLQSVATQLSFVCFFDIFCIAKCKEVILLQSVTGCHYKVRQVVPSVTDYITRCLR